MMEVSQEQDKTEKTKKTCFRYGVEQCKTCGSGFSHFNKSRHDRTKKHLDAKYLWHDMMEINEFPRLFTYNMNIFISMYNASVQWCCGGRADPHSEITREQAIRDYYEQLKYYRQLQQQSKKIMRC